MDNFLLCKCDIISTQFMILFYLLKLIKQHKLIFTVKEIYIEMLINWNKRKGIIDNTFNV